MLVTKRLIYVFENDAPLPIVRKWGLTDGMFLAKAQRYLLEQDDNIHIQSIEPQFSDFFDDHLHATTFCVEFTGHDDLNYEHATKSAEASAYRRSSQYLLSAMLFRPDFMSPFASFVTIPNERRVCHSHRMMEFAPLEFDLPPLTKANFNRVDQLYPKVCNAMTKSGGRLPTAIRYYHQAFRSDIALPIRFLGLMMAVESLFSHATTELSHQVSERVAYFVESHSENRLALYDSMKGWYGTRSKIAHGVAVNANKVNLENEFVALLRVLRTVLLRILDDGALTTLFRSASSNEFARALKKLVFFGDCL